MVTLFKNQEECDKYGVTGAIIGSVMSVANQNKALAAQSRANAQTARSYIHSMNYNLQGLEQQRRDAFEATIQDLEKTKLQGNRQEAGVFAAVNEGIAGGGRTARLLVRSAEADTNRAISSIKSNYRKKSNEIDLNREVALLNGRQAVASVPQLEAPSFLSTVLQLGTAYYNTKQVLDSISAIRTQAGVPDNEDDMSSSSTFNPMFTKTTSSSGNYAMTLDWEKMLGSVDKKYTFSYSNPYTQRNQQLSYF